MIRPPDAENYTCPEGRVVFNNGRIRFNPTFCNYRYCICDADFYGDKGLCKKCMEGGTCHRKHFHERADLRPGIMKNRGSHLVKCPIPSACNPSDSCNSELNTSLKDTNAPSNRPQVLSLFTTCNHLSICHQGNTDRCCSRCLDGFYKLSGLCFRCKNGDLLYYYIFVPVFAVSFLALIWSYFFFSVRPLKWFVVTAIHFLLRLIMMLLEFLPAWFFKLNMVVFVLCMTSRGKAVRTLISIRVFHIQTTDFMVSSFNVWPKKVIAAQGYLSSYWNLYFPSLSCDLPLLFTPVGKFAFLLLLPLACLTMVGEHILSSC